MKRKELHETPFASLGRIILHAINPRLPVNICSTCVRPTDEVLGTAGDFSLCDRCGASITSKSGVAVRTPVKARSIE